MPIRSYFCECQESGLRTVASFEGTQNDDPLRDLPALLTEDSKPPAPPCVGCEQVHLMVEITPEAVIDLAKYDEAEDAEVAEVPISPQPK